MRKRRSIWTLFSILVLLGPPLLGAEKPARRDTRKVRGESASRAKLDAAASQPAPITPVPDAEVLSLPPELARALSTSHQGLTEEPVPGVPGAYRVDLRGRFQSAMVAVVTPDGSVEVSCGSLEPAKPRPTPEPVPPARKPE